MQHGQKCWNLRHWDFHLHYITSPLDAAKYHTAFILLSPSLAESALSFLSFSDFLITWHGGSYFSIYNINQWVNLVILIIIIYHPGCVICSTSVFYRTSCSASETYTVKRLSSHTHTKKKKKECSRSVPVRGLCLCYSNIPHTASPA